MNLKVAFIINPISGAKNKSHLPGLIQNLSQAHNLTPHIVFTERPNHAAELTQELTAKGYNRIIAVGGDGTINEIARELVGTDVEFGIIPQGSGNGLARHLGVPLKADKAIEVALTHTAQPIDTATINGKSFFCTTGAGFDALIGNKFAEAPTRGFTTYATIATREFFGYQPQEYKITVDGTVYNEKAFLVTVANASQYGNNAYIAPQADLQDGILDVVVITRLPLAIGPVFAARMFLKKIETSSYVKIFKGKHIIIEREQEDYVHLDGEPGRMGRKLDISIQPLSLKAVF